MVHTKLSCPNSDSSNDLINKELMDEKNNASDSLLVRQTNQMKIKKLIQNFIANIFIKEVNLILYDDSKDHLHQKNNIASIFFDDFIICYAEEVNI